MKQGFARRRAPSGGGFVVDIWEHLAVSMFHSCKRCAKALSKHDEKRRCSVENKFRLCVKCFKINQKL